jgi:hypothetical protein
MWVRTADTTHGADWCSTVRCVAFVAVLSASLGLFHSFSAVIDQEGSGQDPRAAVRTEHQQAWKSESRGQRTHRDSAHSGQERNGEPVGSFLCRVPLVCCAGDLL